MRHHFLKAIVTRQVEEEGEIECFQCESCKFNWDHTAFVNQCKNCFKDICPRCNRLSINYCKHCIDNPEISYEI